MKHFDTHAVVKAAITGCYFYPGTCYGIMLKKKQDDKALLASIETLNNEIPPWLRLETPKRTRTKIEYQNDSQIIILNEHSIIRGISFNAVFIDSRLAVESLISNLLPHIVGGTNNQDKIILFENT